MLATDIIGVINDKGEISGSDKFIDSFWSNPNARPSYVEKYNTTINANDGYYILHLYRHTESGDEDVKEDIDTFGDVFFSKLVIEYYKNEDKSLNAIVLVYYLHLFCQFECVECNHQFFVGRDAADGYF